MSAPGIQMARNDVPPRRRAIDDDIVELLRDEGPQLAPDVRTRIGCASQARFDAALLFLLEERVIERVSCGHTAGLRIAGDTRPVPGGMTSFVDRQVYRRRGAK